MAGSDVYTFRVGVGVRTEMLKMRVVWSRRRILNRVG